MNGDLFCQLSIIFVYFQFLKFNEAYFCKPERPEKQTFFMLLEAVLKWRWKWDSCLHEKKATDRKLVFLIYFPFSKWWLFWDLIHDECAVPVKKGGQNLHDYPKLKPLIYVMFSWKWFLISRVYTRGKMSNATKRMKLMVQTLISQYFKFAGFPKTRKSIRKSGWSK